MRINFSSSARARDHESGETITDAKRLRRLEGLVFAGGSCGDWVDVEFLDLGISGGTIRCTYSDAGGLRVTTEYLAPGRLTDDQARRLAEDTWGQWSDGIGEEGFRFETGDLAIVVWPDDHEAEMRIEQLDDGIAVAAPSLASIAARKGDLVALKAALASGQDVEIVVQGMTPLHWAITYGHFDASAVLLNHGANPNASDSMGNTPLLVCALTNRLDDETGVRIARLLLEKGARKEVANGAGKTRLLALLSAPPLVSG